MQCLNTCPAQNLLRTLGNHSQHHMATSHPEENERQKKGFKIQRVPLLQGRNFCYGWYKDGMDGIIVS